MKTIIMFIVPGEPKGKGRPRFTKAGHIYTPPKTEEYENLVRLEYQRQCGGGRHFDNNEPLKMSIGAVYKIPKSASKKKRAAMLAGEIQPTKKPDADNIIKIIADALNGIAYRDDAQIVSVEFRKWYSEKPSVSVTIENMICGKESEKI